MIRFDCHSGSTKRDGRWVVPRRIEVLVTSGSVTLDFTQAVISQPSVQIEASVNSGSLTLVTKPGILVDADEVAIRSGSVRIRAPWGPDVPVTLRIDVSGQVGSGSITARPPRRTFWQWLLRRPRALSARPVTRLCGESPRPMHALSPDLARSSRQAGEEPAALAAAALRPEQSGIMIMEIVFNSM